MNKKNVTYTVQETFNSFKDVKSVYKIVGGFKEVGQGRMGWRTACGKNVFKNEWIVANYTVSYLVCK